ncbi:acyltransferase family protein [Pseudomonas nitroreducens]|uniref:acyltransferase family protein n=1 Tax=Pseudomonas nitroreducens TaxID=46680 RepID=UPI00351D5FA8
MKLRSLELLRGLAALWVVLYHIQGVYNPDNYNWQGPIADFIAVGHSGVDLFFVISGFVIAWTSFLKPTPSRSPVQFAIRRFFRVAPLYWLATILWAFVYPEGVTLERLARSLAFMPTDIWPTPFYGFPVLYVGWSLNYEIYFYGIVLLLLVLRLDIASLIAAMAVMLIGVPLALTGLVSINPGTGNTVPTAALKLATNPLVWEFVMGVVVAWVFKVTTRASLPRGVWLGLGMLAIGWFIVFLTGSKEHFSLIYRGIPSALLVYMTLEMERREVLRFGKFSEWAGSVSYALYVVHPFVVIYAQKHLFLPPKEPHLTILAYLVLGGVSIALAAWVHRKVEQPIIQFGIDCSLWVSRLLPNPRAADDSSRQ